MAKQNNDSDLALNLPLGVTLSIGEVLFTVAIAAMVKLIANDISVFMILFFRYLLCIPLLLLTATFQRGAAAFRVQAKAKLALRSAMGLGSFGCLFAALQTIELSKMTALLQTIPIFVTLLAPILLGETVGWRRRMAVLIGFVGAVLIVDPTHADWFNQGVLLGIASPFFGALMLLTLRRLGQTDHPSTTALWYNIIGAAVFFGVCLSLDIPMPNSENIVLILCIIGVMSSFQQFFLAHSYKLAPASVLAPLRYLSVPFGVGASVIFFNEKLTSSFFVGTAILVGASFFILKRSEKIKAKS
ncbi:MAG: Riboflavin transporter [Rhodospirillaceae bacterium]|jgi:drug/metabolite transporter (DMT)-like permease|nr:DMT family transporter [Alphaproteobacteria bacterium]MBL6777735.1 DMT family transporter [Alphaproteobacteria bacterium]CAI8326227.1 MAG: Riboflavin transporter [Rhodospirillaceae bacterium]